MKYYIYKTLEQAQEASASIYDLNAPPRSERATLYAYSFIPHSSNSTYAIEWLDVGYDTGEVLDGLTFLTKEEAIEQGYLITDE